MSVLILGLEIGTFTVSVSAFTISVTDPSVTRIASWARFMTELTPATPVALGAGSTQAIRDLFATDYPEFTYAAAGAARTGTLTISQLDAFQNGFAGGLDILASFTGDPAPHIYRWIQYVDLDPAEPFRGALTSPFTDPPPVDRDDGLPFYWTDTQRNTAGVGYVTGGNINNNPSFFDTPRADDARAPVTMRLNLFLTDFDSATKTVSIYDGVQYGFRITTVPEPATLVLMVIGIAATLIAVSTARVLER